MPIDHNKYKNVTFSGSVFPDQPIGLTDVRFNQTMQKEYLPVLDSLDLPKGLKCLMIAMTHVEGFREGTKAYRTNNPGNIGNMDNGATRRYATLKEGVEAQAAHLRRVASGLYKPYKVGQNVLIRPFFSAEIYKNVKSYGIPYNLPGYRFVYTGQLDQFIKLYSTGARVTNSYLNAILTVFAENGAVITPQSTMETIVQMTW